AAGPWCASTPCLFLPGQVTRSDMMGDLGVRQMGPQEVDIISIVRPITKYAATVMEPERIRYHLEKAVHLARAGRPGPVWIDIPLDVQATTVEEESLAPFDPSELPPAGDAARLPEQVGEAIALLNRAERPVLIAGHGIRLGGAQAEFAALIERLGVPVVAALPNGCDLLPFDHPL